MLYVIFCFFESNPYEVLQQIAIKALQVINVASELNTGK